MSKKSSAVARGPWKRPEPTATRPNRAFGGYYRSADRKIRGKDLRGLPPLQTAEDAAVAAVRLGYSVIDSQIERGLDMARRLRTAADRAGAVDTSEAISLLEGLLSRGVFLGLELLEATASQEGSPIKRLVTAQYRLLGSLLGLQIDERPPVRDPSKSSEDRTARTATPEPPEPARHAQQVRISHTTTSTRRAVRVVRAELAHELRLVNGSLPVVFYPVSGTAGNDLPAMLTLAPKAAPVLAITTTKDLSGLWRAAVCDADGNQMGILEVEF